MPFPQRTLRFADPGLLERLAGRPLQEEEGEQGER